MSTVLDSNLEQLKYPRGRLEFKPSPSPAEIEAWIGEVEALPAQLRAAVEGLSDAQLDTPYRPGGWTVRQLTHHIPDSHMHAYIRVMWTVTEPQPTIKAYDQDPWSNQEYHRTAPVENSLKLLEAVHRRLVAVLRTLSAEQWQRTFVHPEHQRSFSLEQLLQMYAWHSRHHLAHITGLRERNGW